MQDAPLRRLPVSSVVQFVDEMYRGHFGPVENFGLEKLHRTFFADQRWKAGHFLLDRRVSDKSPLRRAMQDNRKSQRAETERGLRRIGQPFGCGRGGAKTPCPGSPGPSAAAQPMLGSYPEPHHLSSNAG
jgi:hypothetical protein